MRRTLVFLVLLVCACKTPATKASRARDELASWAATGQMLSSGWSRGDAQTPYVKSTVKVAIGEVAKLKPDLQKDAPSADDVDALYKKLSDALERNDRASAAQLSRPFGELGKKLQKPS